MKNLTPFLFVAGIALGSDSRGIDAGANEKFQEKTASQISAPEAVSVNNETKKRVKGVLRLASPFQCNEELQSFNVSTPPAEKDDDEWPEKWPTLYWYSGTAEPPVKIHQLDLVNIKQIEPQIGTPKGLETWTIFPIEENMEFDVDFIDPEKVIFLFYIPSENDMKGVYEWIYRNAICGSYNTDDLKK